MKSGTTSHIKFKNLKRSLSRPEYQIVGILQGIWNLAYEGADDGIVGRYSNDEIAAFLEWDGDADLLISSLIACRWLDKGDDGRLVIHDWDDHKPHFIKKRETKRKERASSRQQLDPCRQISGDSRQQNGSCATQSNPIQSNPTKKEERAGGRDSDLVSASVPVEARTNVVAAWDSFEAAWKSARPNTPRRQLDNSRARNIAESLQVVGKPERIANAISVIMNSPNPACISISRNATIDTFIKPDNVLRYCELAEDPDSKNIPEQPKPPPRQSEYHTGKAKELAKEYRERQRQKT